MILKPHELNELNLQLNKIFLFYGKNDGLKNQSVNILINLCSGSGLASRSRANPGRGSAHAGRHPVETTRIL